MSLFKKKTKEEKVLEEIKKKKEQMDKLKEEIVKMGKLVLKDGKLTKVEDAPKEEVKATKVPSTELPPIDYTNPNMDDVMGPVRRMAQAPPVQPRQVPPPLSQEEYQRIQRRQQEMAAYEQQYRMEQQAQAEQQRQLEMERQAQLQMEEYQRQQMRQQPQQYQQPQQLPVVSVTIEMITGSTLTINIAGDKIESFVDALNLAIDNQSSFPMANKVINGRNVVSYTLE